MAGVLFEKGSFDEAQAKARASKQNLLVEVWATWCPPCKLQEQKIFHTAVGAELTQDLVAWRVDFDAPAQQRLMRKWNVLRLPTVIFFRPDGTEIDRLEGFEDQDAWLAKAKDAAAGKDPVRDLRTQLVRADLKQKDGEPSLALHVEIGHRLLVRGNTAEGRKHLDRARHKGGPTSDAAQDALYILGRYESRARQDPKAGYPIWDELWRTYPNGKHVDTAAWWAADALETQKKPALADRYMRSHVVKKPTQERLSLALSFMEKTGRRIEGFPSAVERAHLSREARVELLGRFEALPPPAEAQGSRPAKGAAKR